LLAALRLPFFFQLCGARQFTQCHRDGFLLPAPEDADLYRGTRRCNRSGEIARILHLMIIHGSDNIADLDSFLGCRAVGLELSDKSALAFFRSSSSAIAGVTNWIFTPIHSRVTSPLLLSCSTTNLTVSTKISKATPTKPPDGEEIALLTPMTSPSTLKVCPPELPLLTGASI
jgi:hypothetical protein